MIYNRVSTIKFIAMRNDSIQVSIIIVNYNTRQMTQECIDSVLNRTEDLSYEIILVDNKSIDGSKECFEKDSRIRYVYSYENMGFGRANNVGLMLARGEYFFLLNSDTLLVNNAIKIFYEYAKVHDLDRKAIYGSWLLNKDLSIGLSFGTEPTMKSQLKRIVAPYLLGLRLIPRGKREHEDHPNYGKTCEVGYVSGANMFLHRSIYEEYGGFDHFFFMYMEEAEWQKRVKQHGVKSIVIEGPKIIHLHGGSDNVKRKDAKRASINTLIMMRHSRRYFFKKYYNRWQRLFYQIISFVLETPVILTSSHYSVSDKLRYIFG